MPSSRRSPRRARRATCRRTPSTRRPRTSRASSRAASRSSKPSWRRRRSSTRRTLDAGGRVVFGATVDLEDEDSGAKVTYQIVGDDEADLKLGLISISSPIARALIGKEAGDVAEVQAPGRPQALLRSSRSATSDARWSALAALLPGLWAGRRCCAWRCSRRRRPSRCCRRPTPAAWRRACWRSEAYASLALGIVLLLLERVARARGAAAGQGSQFSTELRAGAGRGVLHRGRLLRGAADDGGGACRAGRRELRPAARGQRGFFGAQGACWWRRWPGARPAPACQALSRRPSS